MHPVKCINGNTLYESNSTKMLLFARLEKEYTTIKNKEMEEQIEIKVCVCVRAHTSNFFFELIY